MLAVLADRLYRFSRSAVGLLCVFLWAYACVVLEQAALGICVLVLYICLLYVASADVMPSVFPLLLIYCLAFFCQTTTWLPYLCIPFAAAMLYRFIRNRKDIRAGSTLFGLIAATAAALIGGLGHITAAEYFSPGALFQVMGIGAFLIVIYLFFKSSMPHVKEYDLHEHICLIMYLCAVFIAFLMLRVFAMHPDILAGRDQVVLKYERYASLWRNGASNLAIMFLPAIFCYARRHSPWHLISAVVVYVVVMLGGARTAILVGGFILLCGFFYYTYRNRLLLILLICTLIVCGILGIVFFDQIMVFFTDFLCITIEDVDVQNDVRYKIYARAWQDFQFAPFFGRGFGYQGNNDLYGVVSAVNPIDAYLAVFSYHSLFLQILASTGIFGLLCYGVQFFLRARAILVARKMPHIFAFGASYIALLLYSQLDPGIFSPLPFSILATFFFVLIDGDTPFVRNKKASSRVAE